MGGGSAGLHRIHEIVVDEGPPWYVWVGVGVLALVGIALAIATVVKWRRGKHRADPQLRAVDERLVKIETLAEEQPLTGRVDEHSGKIRNLEAEVAAYREALMRTWAATGQEIPKPCVKNQEPHLKVIEGGGGAA